MPVRPGSWRGLVVDDEEVGMRHEPERSAEGFTEDEKRCDSLPFLAMTNAIRPQYVAACALAALLLSAPRASAHGDDDRDRPEHPRQSTAGEEPGAEVDEENHWSAGLDFVVGFGRR